MRWIERWYIVRIVVSGSGLFVMITLIVLIHISILNKSVRDEEANAGLSSSMDYALDVMGDMYKKMNYEVGDADEYTNLLIQEFCSNLEERIGSDGEFTISVINADIQTGTFEIVVEETYEYAFQGRKGTTRCERAVKFSS